jgi:hypothetical protein
MTPIAGIANGAATSHQTNILNKQSAKKSGYETKLINAYFGIDTETLWKTTKDNIPPLKKSIQKMQKEQKPSTKHSTRRT